ncbi:hypothetical protein HYQ46_011684 [Verticillium longisporum]|nr:hypothetical protein HYQ46_011684 [Verticillium longisporum]
MRCSSFVHLLSKAHASRPIWFGVLIRSNPRYLVLPIQLERQAEATLTSCAALAASPHACLDRFADVSRAQSMDCVP